MEPLNLADVTAYVEKNIGAFHEARIERIRDLSLNSMLKGKNPYLFRAKDTNNADDLIRFILDAYLSSGEETMFGNFLEELAIFINSKVYGGRKAGIPGIDLDFERNDIRWLVSIKSGPVWGNASAVGKMVQSFNSAKQTLRTSGGYKGQIEFVNGCCYGIDDNPVKDRGYSKYCGQRFWSFISGMDNLYEEIIIPLGHRTKEWNDQIRVVYEATRFRLIKELHTAGLMLGDGTVNWRKLVQVTSKPRR